MTILMGRLKMGSPQSFDLELQTAGILGTQDPAQFTVTYHASLADAQAGALPLGSPFSNSVLSLRSSMHGYTIHLQAVPMASLILMPL